MSNKVKWLSAIGAALMLIIMGTMGLASAQQTPAHSSGKIEGVVMKDGQPLANAQVRLVKPTGSATTQPAGGRRGRGAGLGAAGARGRGGLGQLTPVAQTTTGAQGQFSFDNIIPGPYGVLAGGRGEGIGRQRIAVRPGQTAQVTIDVQQIARGGRRGGSVPPTTNAN